MGWKSIILDQLGISRKSRKRLYIKQQRDLMSKGMWWDVLHRDKFTCQYCGRTRADGVKLHVDHVLALANGGKTIMSNLVTACDTCNLGKKAKYI